MEAHGGLRVDASIATGDGGTSSQRTSGLSDAMLTFDATWMEKGTARPSQSTPQKNHHWQLLSVNFGKSSNEKHCHEIASMHGTFDTTTSTRPKAQRAKSLNDWSSMLWHNTQEHELQEGQLILRSNFGTSLPWLEIHQCATHY